MEQYVLRYWETEFLQLKPQKNRAGNRIYTNKDIQLIMHIKTLLREKKYTIEGAKKILENYSPELIQHQSETQLHIVDQAVSEIKKEKPSVKKDLEEIKYFLENLLKTI